MVRFPTVDCFAAGAATAGADDNVFRPKTVDLFAGPLFAVSEFRNDKETHTAVGYQPIVRVAYP